LNKNWYNLDTKANLLNKLGKKKEAIATAEEAVKLAKAAGEDATETEALLKKLKK
jgi:predicted RNA polymerase sigma factor